jgi:programmed cell death 8 (apoptosis-inducing factor)
MFQFLLRHHHHLPYYSSSSSSISSSSRIQSSGLIIKKKWFNQHFSINSLNNNQQLIIKPTNKANNNNTIPLGIYILTCTLITTLVLHQKSKQQDIVQLLQQNNKYPYVIIGSGTAAHAALEALRFGDPAAEILMIAEESFLPRHDANDNPPSFNQKQSTSTTTSATTTATTSSNNNSTTITPNTILQARLREVFNEWRRQLSSGLATEGNNAVTLVKCEKFSDVKINVEDKTITLQTPHRTIIRYEKCLLATAGKPRDFYVLDKEKIGPNHSMLDNVNTLHDATDFQNLATAALDSTKGTSSPAHITVVGGGFLGTEVVAALAEAGTCKVMHVLGEPTALAQYLPLYLSEHITSALVALGVETRGEALVTAIKQPPPSSNISSSSSSNLTSTYSGMITNITPSASSDNTNTNNNNTKKRVLRNAFTRTSISGDSKLSVSLVGSERLSIDTDYVVLASTNVKPELVGLEIPGSLLEVYQGGIVTNSSLEAFSGFFVAGNAASYYDPAIGRRRVDTYDHAVNSGMWAAYNMMTQTESSTCSRYSHQPYFKANLAAIGMTFHGLGKIDANLETVGVWFKRGYDSPGSGGSGGSDLSSASSSSSSSNSSNLSGTSVSGNSSNNNSSTSGGGGGSNSATTSSSSTTTPYNPTEMIPHRRGVVYYVERGKVVGILLCNAAEMLDQARDVLSQQRVITAPLEEIPKLILLAPSHWLDIVATK